MHEFSYYSTILITKKEVYSMEKNKKIVLLFPHLPNPRMLKRIQAFKKSNKVEVIYWDRGIGYNKKNELPSDVSKHVIKRKGNEGKPLKRLKNTVKVIIDALKLIKKIKPDLLYVSKTDMLFVAYIYKRLFNNKTELVYEVSDLHSLLIDKQKNISKKLVSWLLVKLEKMLCERIKLLVVTSEYFYSKFYKDVVDASKMLFIPNTPDPKVFNGFKRKKNKIYTIGFIGAVRYAKQIEMLIDAAELKGINVFIAGKGIDSQRIEKYAKDKGFVQIYGEYQYEKEIRSLYERVDCIYSVYDANMKNVQIALPNRLYEAVYTKTPIIAAKDTYLGELVEKYKIGKTIEHESMNDLIGVIEELRFNDDLVKIIKSNLAILKDKWVLERYNKKLLDAINT